MKARPATALWIALLAALFSLPASMAPAQAEGDDPSRELSNISVKPNKA